MSALRIPQMLACSLMCICHPFLRSELNFEVVGVWKSEERRGREGPSGVASTRRNAD